MKPTDCLSWLLAVCAMYIASCPALAHAQHDPIAQPKVISSLTDGRTERSIVHIQDDIYRFHSNGHSGLIMLTEEGAVLVDPLNCLLYTSPSPRDKRQSRMPSSA